MSYVDLEASFAPCRLCPKEEKMVEGSGDARVVPKLRTQAQLPVLSLELPTAHPRTDSIPLFFLPLESTFLQLSHLESLKQRDLSPGV
ncbi:hypothetical protein P7K49_004532 [Saguinus oedipus]|uniref:Uncharacterized protein n=1 Tax=Saguinus oedipus TaxID=9490 RepID=A0ABQ9W7P7_SAGOE|nr:hypothetical protein P7K49_004532 [Saguinus oedipus]